MCTLYLFEYDNDTPARCMMYVLIFCADHMIHHKCKHIKPCFVPGYSGRWNIQSASFESHVNLAHICPIDCMLFVSIQSIIRRQIARHIICIVCTKMPHDVSGASRGIGSDAGHPSVWPALLWASMVQCGPLCGCFFLHQCLFMY